MWLCADLDAFFVSVEQALNPGLVGKPVVIGGLPKERGVVTSASYEARRFGIHAGMPTARAYRLCPDAIFLRGNYHIYHYYSKKFCEILGSYSPEVNIASIDEGYVNIKGTERLFGPPRRLAQRLKTEIKERLNITASVGIARTKIFSKIACSQSKPDGLLIIQPDDEINFLSPLKVDVLPAIGPRHLEILKNLNINTVADLMKASDWVLEMALGSYYKVIKFFIQGGDYHPRDSMKSISRETTLIEDTMDKELIYGLLYYLIEQGCRRLRQDRLVAKRLRVKIRFSDFKTVSRQTKLPNTNAQQQIFKYGARVLENILKERKRVRLIGISLSGFEYDGLQPSMFAPKQGRIKQLNYALDKTRKRFGWHCLFPANTFILKNYFREK